MNPIEVVRQGDEHAAAELIQQGWQCEYNTQQPGMTLIEARSGEAALLVLVKTAVCPHTTPQFSTYERRSVQARADKLGFEPWLASLQIGTEGQLVGRIQWAKPD